MSNHIARQDIHIGGWECGFETEIQMVIEFTVTKARAQTTTSPAEPATAEVKDVQFFRNRVLTTMPDWLIDQIVDRQEFNVWLLSEAKDQSQSAAEDLAEARREEIELTRPSVYNTIGERHV